MVETEGVSYFLTHDVLAFVGVVVGVARAGPKVVVVPLARAWPGGGAARLEPDRGAAEPAVVPVAPVADLVPARRRAAVLVPSLSGDAGRVEHGRLRPVARGLAQAALPLTGRQVVAELDRERVRRSCPVVAAPRVIRERRRRRDGRYCSDRGDSESNPTLH